MKVLITGARGFVGTRLRARLAQGSWETIGSTRTAFPGYAVSPELGPNADWSELVRGVEVIVHLAGCAHVSGGVASKEVEENYHRVNALGTARLAEQSAEAGVKQFIFLSSCHALASESEAVLDALTTPHPSSAYGRSKLAAEQLLRENLSGTGTSYTILRPPPVYGEGNVANFARLISLVKSGVPMPFASIQNRRSFIGVENLVDLIATCMGHEKAVGKTYFPSDGDPVSTPDLIRLIAQSLGKPARLFPVPPSVLALASMVPGMGMLQKLMCSLAVSSEPIFEELGWNVPYTFDEGIRGMISSGPNKEGL